MATTYSFVDTQAAIAGPGGAFSIREGSAEEGIKVTMRAAKNDLVIGADGFPLHSLRADNSATVTITLLKNSPVNNLLSDMYNLQRLSSPLWGQNQITINNPIIGDLVTLQAVAFAKQPEVVFAEKGGTNTWEFEAGSVLEVLAAAV